MPMAHTIANVLNRCAYNDGARYTSFLILVTLSVRDDTCVHQYI